MRRLFEIEQDLDYILGQIEEAGGELTPELEEALTITEAEFKDKIVSYAHAMKAIEGDIDVANKEKDRVAQYIKSKKLRVDKLQSTMVDALKLFGNRTKTGSYEIDIEGNRVCAQKSTSCELNEDNIAKIMQEVYTYLIEYMDNTSIENGCDSLDYETVVAHTINTLGWGENPINVIKEDFDAIKISVSYDITLKQLIEESLGRAVTYDIANRNYDNVIVTSSKSALSADLKLGKDIGTGKLVENHKIKLK